MGIIAKRSCVTLALAGAALALAPAAHAQSDPTESLPTVTSAGLVTAAQDCSDAQASTSVDLAVLAQRGWTETIMTDDDGEELDLPVHFFNREPDDPLIVIPTNEDVPAICIATGVVSEGATSVPAIETAFADTFGEGAAQGQQTIYTHEGNMIVTNFEDDEDQGLLAQIVVLEQQSGD